MKIGDRIKMRREQLMMSQDELAHKLGYKSRSSIAKIENDASGLPQTKIAAIASALGTTPEYIMGWATDEPAISPAKAEITGIISDMTDDQLKEVLRYIKFIKQGD